MIPNIHPADDFDWQYWVDRWERMQERYLVKRNERFDVIIELIQGTQAENPTIVDLGCGPGSLMVHLLEENALSQVIGIDFDPTLLFLGQKRLARFGQRIKLYQADLRDRSWPVKVGKPVDAVVSATALHWLPPAKLSELYQQIANILRPGGIFLNADHAGSDHAGIQKSWDKRNQRILNPIIDDPANDWDRFWSEYGLALGINADEIHDAIQGGYYDGIEKGMPLVWHIEHLQKAGFRAVDCFWRGGYDAIYGGICADHKGK